MSGIAGTFSKGAGEQVETMLNILAHRGNFNRRIIELNNATIGIVWSKHEHDYVERLSRQGIFRDGPGYGHKSEVVLNSDHLTLHRDELGVAPLYTCISGNGNIVFSSEVKALLPFGGVISEVPPGSEFSPEGLKLIFELKAEKETALDAAAIAAELREIMRDAIRRRIHDDTTGAWLSGGLDSSTMAALARPMVKTLHTFAGGLCHAPDLKFAQDVAQFIGSEHHELVVTLPDMLRVLPDVIFHLESFDAWLIRSSVINYMVARQASEYVAEVFSGEGGDELFAGYDYLKSIPEGELGAELLDITRRLHNTALQRVDRSSSAFGTTAHVIFTDPVVFSFALKIPVSMKIVNGVEKWILRKAMTGLLPENVLNRTKAKFWEGAGVESILADHASKHVSDADFATQRNLPNGWILNSKEELFYFRIFKEIFGELDDLNWMGRTKGTPIS